MLEKLIFDSQDLFSSDIYSLVLMPLVSARLQHSCMSKGHIIILKCNNMNEENDLGKIINLQAKRGTICQSEKANLNFFTVVIFSEM